MNTPSSSSKTSSPPQFLIHHEGDNVGVAAMDLSAGQSVHGLFLDSRQALQAELKSNIPLGHKLALQDFNAGDTMIKYGVDCGKFVAPVKKGEHVHVHNVKTKRW